MPERIQVSELTFAGYDRPGLRIQVSEVTFSTAAAAVVGNRVQVSELAFSDKGPPVGTSRIQVSELQFSTRTDSPGYYVWYGSGTTPRAVQAVSWDGLRVLSMAGADSTGSTGPVLPPVTGDVYTDVYDDTY